MQYRKEIDGLRAVAVIPVLFFHAGYELFSGGYVGVDVFFVISGYLITSIILNDLQAGRFSIKTFYVRRSKRILPALVLVTLCSMPFAWVLLTPSHFDSYANSLLGVATFSSNILFWLESGYFDTASELKPLLHTWSLAVEEQYYILFPLFLMAIWPYGRKPILISLAVMCVISLAIAQWGAYNAPGAAFFLLPARGWELLFGVFCAFYLNQKTEPSSPHIEQSMSLLGLLLIGYAVFSFDATTPTPSFYTMIPVIGTVLLILFANSGTLANRMLGLGPIVGIGLISYSAYLWHQPIIAFLKYSYLFEAEPFRLLTVMLVFPLSYLSWKYVERPFRTSNIKAERVLGVSAMALSVLFVVGLSGRLELYPSYLQIAHPEWSNEYIKEPAPALVDCEGFEVVQGDTSCKQIGDGGYKIVIWGDSHSHMLRTTTPDMEGATIFNITHGGCPPLLGVKRFDDLTNSVNCNNTEIMSSYLDYINGIEPDLVVLVGRWTLYLKGWIRDGENQPAHHLIVDDHTGEEEVLSSVKTRMRILEEAFVRTIDGISSNSEVVVVSQIPDYGWFSYRNLFKSDQVSKSKINAWHIEEEVLMDLLKGNEYTLLDGKSLFCTDAICATRIDGTLIYSDDNHLNDKGAEILWASLLKPFTNRGASYQ